MYRLLQEKSANWSEIGRQFGTSLDFRNSLKHDPRASDSDRLEEVLNKWVTSTTDQHRVTWQEFIEVMRSLKYADVIAETKKSYC